MKHASILFNNLIVTIRGTYNKYLPIHEVGWGGEKESKKNSCHRANLALPPLKKEGNPGNKNTEKSNAN